jgi:hypothetical protein
MIALDHLVVACRTLALGRDWCATTFGVAPETGGRHPSMGTHNAVLNVSSTRFPASYLELIAIDPDAPSPSRRRWFDLDALTWEDSDAPRLVHWVARTDDIVAASAALRRTGFDPGPIVAAERTTPRGLLRWRITVRDDGARPAAGAVPLLIEWSDVHPVDALPARGVALEALALGGVAAELARELDVAAATEAEAPPLSAEFSTRRGRVTLAAPPSRAA